MAVESEATSESAARKALESVLHQRLRRFPPQPGRAAPDYVDEYNAAFEMKAVMSEELRRLRAQTESEGWFSSTRLGMRWSVLLEAPALGDKFRPMPDFPADNLEQIAALEAEGFVVTRKAQRQAEWENRFSGQAQCIPRIRGLSRSLEEHFMVLEQTDITNTREAYAAGARSRKALAEIARLTGGGLCLAHTHSDGRGGIELVLGYGYRRTGLADTFALRVQAWLTSDSSSNLRQSLWPEFSTRHGVLVFDASEPEYWSAQDADTGSFLPEAPLSLPVEIDVLWCVVGRHLLRYRPSDGWRGFPAAN